MRRHGVTLVELLIAMPLLLAVMVVSGALYTTALRDVPAQSRARNGQNVVLAVSDALARDVDAASGGAFDNNGRLILQIDGKNVIWHAAGPRVTRTGETRNEWDLDKGRLVLEPYRYRNRLAGVVVRSHVLLKAENREIPKLETNRLLLFDSAGLRRAGS